MFKQKYTCFFRTLQEFNDYALEIEAEKQRILFEILNSRNKIGIAKISLRQKHNSTSKQKEIIQFYLNKILKELKISIKLEEDLEFIQEEEDFLRRDRARFITFIKNF
ncbi:MAG: hypothetical protein V3574_00690 [Candidatus Moraniibacteriota bacterium]